MESILTLHIRFMEHIHLQLHALKFNPTIKTHDVITSNHELFHHKILNNNYHILFTSGQHWCPAYQQTVPAADPYRVLMSRKGAKVDVVSISLSSDPDPVSSATSETGWQREGVSLSLPQACSLRRVLGRFLVTETGRRRPRQRQWG